MKNHQKFSHQGQQTATSATAPTATSASGKLPSLRVAGDDAADDRSNATGGDSSDAEGGEAEAATAASN